MRSLLLVPLADATAREASASAAADALVLCLGDRDGEDRATTRRSALDLLRAAQTWPEQPLLYVRLSDIDRPGFDADLAAVMPGEPDGILLGRAATGADVQHLGAKLAVQEAELELGEGSTAIIAEAAGHAGGVFGLDSYRGASARLIGLAWDAAALAADLGDAVEADMREDSPLRTVRDLTLLAARAARVAAIDTASDSPDGPDFAAACRRARRLGFNAKLARSAAQVAVINAVFGPEPA